MFTEVGKNSNSAYFAIFFLYERRGEAYRYVLAIFGRQDYSRRWKFARRAIAAVAQPPHYLLCQIGAQYPLKPRRIVHQFIGAISKDPLRRFIENQYTALDIDHHNPVR